MTVHLRRRERAVAQKLLDHAQVGSALEQVRSERVAEPGRMRDETPEGARVEAAAARREEDGVCGHPRETGARLTQVACQPVRRLLSEGQHAFLPSLPADVH